MFVSDLVRDTVPTSTLPFSTGADLEVGSDGGKLGLYSLQGSGGLSALWSAEISTALGRDLKELSTRFESDGSTQNLRCCGTPTRTSGISARRSHLPVMIAQVSTGRDLKERSPLEAGIGLILQ